MIYLNLFNNNEDIEREFRIKLDPDMNILLAFYEYEDYSGDAFVLFEQNGKLYEVHGSHCSCFGLSEESYADDEPSTQWKPEETSIESLKHRLDEGSFGVDHFWCSDEDSVKGKNKFANELRNVLEAL